MSGGKRVDCQRLNIVFAGTPEFAAAALRALLASEHNIVGVLTQPDRPSGRGRKLTASPVKQLALDHEIPVQQPQSLRQAEAQADLAAWRPDVMVVAAYGLILPRPVLEMPALGCVNIHASHLPRWRGAAPIHRAILAGDGHTAITLMRMDEGLDTGDIIAVSPEPIHADDTSAGLHDRLAELGGRSLLDALPDYCAGTLVPVPQPAEGVTYAEKLHKREAPLDFSLSAEQLDRQIRAFNPWPVAETRLQGERLRVWASRSEAAENPTAEPGTVLSVSGETVRVATGDGVLVLLEAQRDGGKRAAAGALLRPLDAVGLRLGT